MSIFRELGMREGKDRVNEELVYNIAKVYGLIEAEIKSVLAEYDLSPAKFNILLVVKHVGGKNGISQNNISSQLLVTTSNITRMLDKLEKDKLVLRSPLPGDRRVNLIKITEKGSYLLDKAWGPYKSKIDKKISGSLSINELNLLIKTLEKLTKNLMEVRS
jgi:DNA-binding MarR family transcriptional regulator